MARQPREQPHPAAGQERTHSNRTIAVAVTVALLAGLIGSLALRPPGAETAASVVATPGNGEGAVSRIRWRLPVSFQSTMPVLGDNPIYVTRQIRAISNGAIDLTIFEPGEIVPAFSITDAVRDGKVKVGYTWLGYDQGKIPASSLIGAVPFGSCS